jgi:isocitrate dehydrogenase
MVNTSISIKEPAMAQTLEKTIIQTVKAGHLTKDLAILVEKGVVFVSIVS